MALSPDIIEEISLLALFNLQSVQEGIKVHEHANPDAAAAAKRLFDKGLITQDDGGYLTDLGIEAAEKLHILLSVLK